MISYNRKYLSAGIIALVCLFLAVPLCFWYHETHTEQVFKDGDLRWFELVDKAGGYTLPFDETAQVFYCPVKEECLGIKTEIPFEVRTGGELVTLQETRVTVDFQQPTAVTVVRDGKTTVLPVQFTSLPMITVSMKTEENLLLPEEEKKATIGIIDPYHTPVYTESRAFFRLRGSGSLQNPKRNYRITFINAMESEVRYPVLGMRESEKWALDAMYSDPSKLRNKLSSDLWNQTNRGEGDPLIYNNLGVEYCELFLNGSLHGLYTICEPTTRRNLPVDKGIGLMVEGIDTTPADYTTPGDMTTAFWSGFEMKYPAKQFEAEWQFFTGRMAAFTQEKRNASVYFPEYFYTNNYIDNYLFLNLIDGADNEKKNLLIAIRNQSEDMRMFLTPWDFDYSFGLRWQDTNNDGIANETDAKKAYEDYKNIRSLFGTSAQLFEDQKLCNLMKQRGTELIASVYSKENIEGLIDGYTEKLMTSGAVLRDSVLYGSYAIEEEAEEIKAYAEKRTTYFKEYLNSLP